MTKSELQYLKSLPSIGLLIQNALHGEVEAQDLLVDMDHSLGNEHRSKFQTLSKWKERMADYRTAWHPTDFIGKSSSLGNAAWPEYKRKMQYCSNTQWVMDKLRFPDFVEKLEVTNDNALICHVRLEAKGCYMDTAHRYLYESLKFSDVTQLFPTWRELWKFMNAAGVRKMQENPGS